MKILIFSTDYLPHIGGAEIAVHELTKRIPEERIAFDMLTPRYSRALSKHEQIGSVSVRRVGIGHPIDKYLFPVTGFFVALIRSRHISYDCVWGIMASFGGLAGALFHRMRNKKSFILTLQEGDDEVHLKRYVFNNDLLFRFLVRPLHYFPIRSATHITVISNYLKKRAEATDTKAPITLLPNGVDVSLFTARASEVEKHALRQKFHIPTSAYVLVSTSRLVYKNGLDTLVRTLPLLNKKVHVLIVGSGPLGTSLSQLARELRVLDRVHFVPTIPQDELPKYLHASDVFVRTSRSEGFGNSFVEAMSAGLPVIGTPVGGIVDFIEDRVTGILVEPDNPGALAHAVSELMQIPEHAKSITEAGRRLAVETYSWDRLAGDFMELCLSIKKI
ncbi:MAG: glycosyltransferase family 4 protein [Candidatus Paceibacterota bacterium]